MRLALVDSTRTARCSFTFVSASDELIPLRFWHQKLILRVNGSDARRLLPKHYFECHM